jgi:hypothetical protein
MRDPEESVEDLIGYVYLVSLFSAIFLYLFLDI